MNKDFTPEELEAFHQSVAEWLEDFTAAERLSIEQAIESELSGGSNYPPTAKPERYL